jgi:hypothetical protein
MKWVTRERPKIDRIRLPVVDQRFIDREAEFLYVPAADVLQVARDRSNGVRHTRRRNGYVGERCSFDAFLAKYHLDDPALQNRHHHPRRRHSRLDLTPQSAGLHAISLGLSRNFTDDHAMLRHGMVMYDALYAWCQS